MTKFDVLVSKAQFAMCVVGNPATSHYELLEFPLPDDPTELVERGMAFVGILALVDCVPCSALAVPLDVDVIDRLSTIFAQKLMSAFEANGHGRGDSVAWLNRLHEMPDPRDCN